jgi:alpha-beta hydrolase superfamily lysophospholipase
MSAGRLLLFLTKHTLLFLTYGVAGAVLTLFAGALWLGVTRVPELKPWHRAVLREEFTAADVSRVRDFDAYRALEGRLFEELQHKVYDRVAEADRRALNRYSAGSLADPASYPENGNRSYELSHAEPRAGVLLVHGLSDSPYILRALAERLHERGCWVVGLRLPGHGTAPSALRTVRWEDWAAAVRLAARHLRGRIGADTPLYFVGFSTGAALSVEYNLARLEGEDLPRVDRLVLLSPAIGVDPLAWLAVWQSRLSGLPGLGNLAWLDVGPEYDPYKYVSFPVNAGQQIYELTTVIDARLTRLAAKGPVRGFPRTLVFQSVADATVSPQAVVKVFMGRLAAEGHEVVAFDINRQAEVGPLLRPDSRDPAERLLHSPAWPFDATLLTNESPESHALVALRRSAGESTVRSEPTDLAWPRGVFALSHVALPVPPDDPIYGAEPPSTRKTLYLGKVELLGEQGLLAIPPNAMVRLRFNPFFSYVWERAERFLLQ